MVLFLYDDTIMGSAKDGFTLTNKRIYSNGFHMSFSDIVFISYSNKGIELCTENQKYTINTAFLKFEEEFLQFLKQLVFQYDHKHLVCSNAENTNLNEEQEAQSIDYLTELVQSEQEEELSSEQSTNIQEDADLSAAYSDHENEVNRTILQKQWQYLQGEMKELHVQSLKVNDPRIGITEGINLTKLGRFIQNYYKVFKVAINPNEVIGLYDDTITCNGEKGFVITYQGIYAYMGSNKGFYAFDEMEKEPTFDSVINSKIFLYTRSGKKDLYCTGSKGPQVLYNFVKLLYQFTNK